MDHPTKKKIKCVSCQDIDVSDLMFCKDIIDFEKDIDVKVVRIEILLRIVFGFARSSFPRLYALELKKSITVADKLIDASFVATFRKTTPWRGGNKSSFNHLLNSWSISLSPSNDLRWRGMAS
ncbi:hypothetical protein Tco_0674812 [Tanacetum coccineum]